MAILQMKDMVIQQISIIKNFIESIILAPKNSDVLKMNEKLLLKINGNQREYLTIDSAEDANNE